MLNQTVDIEEHSELHRNDFLSTLRWTFQQLFGFMRMKGVEYEGCILSWANETTKRLKIPKRCAQVWKLTWVALVEKNLEFHGKMRNVRGCVKFFCKGFVI